MDSTARLVSGVLLFVQNTTAIPDGNSHILLLECIACLGRNFQSLHRICSTIEDNDLQQIVSTALSIQGIENALSVCTVRADDHDDRESRMRALLHGAGLSKTGGNSRRDGLEG